MLPLPQCHTSIKHYVHNIAVGHVNQLVEGNEITLRLDYLLFYQTLKTVKSPSIHGKQSLSDSVMNWDRYPNPPSTTSIVYLVSSLIMCIRSNESLSSYNVAGNLIVLVAIGQVLLATLISISHLNLTSSYSIRSDAADSQPIPSSSWFIYRPPIFLPDILHISSHTVPFLVKTNKRLGYIRTIPTACKRSSWTRVSGFDLPTIIELSGS